MQRYTRDDDAVEGMRPCAHGAWCEWSPLVDAAPDLLAIAKEIAEAPCDLLESERHIRLWAAIKKADPDWLT
jgi:hypothetical protein